MSGHRRAWRCIWGACAGKRTAQRIAMRVRPTPDAAAPHALRRLVDAGVEPVRPRHDAAAAKVHVQVHQLLGGRGLAVVEPDHCVREVHPFRIRREHLRDDAHPVAHQQFLPVQHVRLRGEGAAIRLRLVAAVHAERFVDRVGRVVEHQHVVGEVHVVVGIDPGGQNFALVAVERRRERHAAVVRRRAVMQCAIRRGISLAKQRRRQ